MPLFESAMIKFLKVGTNSRPLARDGVIDGLYATITFTLEPGVRGSRFPNVMNHLYWGYLSPAQAAAAQQELQEIEEAMRKAPISAVIWSPTDPRRGDDPSQPVNHQAANVFEYFVDVDGRPLLTRLQEGVHESIISRQALLVESPGDLRKTIYAGVVIAALGIGWMWLGHALFPRLSLRKVYSRHGGIPLWTFGMDLVMLGVALLIVAPFPAVRDWFFARPLVTIGLAVAAVIGWLVVCAFAGFLPN
jgi:hypothetical protein